MRAQVLGFRGALLVVAAGAWTTSCGSSGGSGAADAGPADASIDASVMEAATGDAPSSDSSAGDAFSVDAGSGDTAAIDAPAGDATTGPDAAISLAGPPAAGPMQAPDGTTNVTLAIDKLFLGDTDPDGTPDRNDGWEHYGYNIDGVDPANPSAFCKPVGNASPATVHGEGVLPGHIGVQNAYGKLILPIILGISSNASASTNAAIASGDFTSLFTLDSLGTGASYDPITAQFASGGNLMATPKFDGTDMWPVIQGSSTTWSSSYLVGNTWVSGATRSGALTLGLGSGSGGLFGGSLHITHALVSMVLDATHASATGGIISGVLSTAEYAAQIRVAAGSIDPSLCSGPTIDSIVAQIEQASDIMQDGTQDPTQTCDGISIGLGFNGALVQLGPTVPAPAPQPNPCGD